MNTDDGTTETSLKATKRKQTSRVDKKSSPATTTNTNVSVGSAIMALANNPTAAVEEQRTKQEMERTKQLKLELILEKLRAKQDDKKEKKKRRKVDEGKIIFDINGVNECGNNNIKYHVATSYLYDQTTYIICDMKNHLLAQKVFL